MSRHRAIILAEGHRGDVQEPAAEHPPSVPAGSGRLVIERQLELLAAAGCRDISVVLGRQQERLRQRLGGRLRLIEGPWCGESESVCSLWVAADALDRGALVIDGRVLFSSEVLDRLLRAPSPDVLLFDRSAALGRETVKVRLAGEYAIDLGVDVPLRLAAGESLGIVKLGADGARRLVPILDDLVAAGRRTGAAWLAFARLGRSWPLVAVDCAGLAWRRIETADDLRAAGPHLFPPVDTSALARRACA